MILDMSYGSTCILLDGRTKPPQAEYPMIMSRPCVELALHA